MTKMDLWVRKVSFLRLFKRKLGSSLNVDVAEGKPQMTRMTAARDCGELGLPAAPRPAVLADSASRTASPTHPGQAAGPRKLLGLRRPPPLAAS